MKIKKILFIFSVLFFLAINIFANEKNITEIKQVSPIDLLEEDTKIDELFSGIIIYSFKHANEANLKYCEYENGKLINSKESYYGNFNYKLPKEKNGLYYTNKKLFSGTTIVKASSFNSSIDSIKKYKNGKLISRTQNSYNTVLVNTKAVEIRTSLRSSDIWDFKRKIINHKKYRDGALVEEGSLDFKFKKIGIWKVYTEDGSILKWEENIDKYNLLKKQRLKKDFTLTRNIEDKEWKKIFYKPIEKTKYYDTDGNEIDRKKFYSKEGKYSGKFIIYENEKVRDVYYYKNKINYKFESFFPNGKLKVEQLLKEKGTFLKKWQGYLKEYYSNGNLKNVYTITEGKSYRSIFDVMKSSLALSPTGNNNTDPVGFYHSVSMSGPFKSYYLNGKLLLEGENSSNLKEKTKIYDKKGKQIIVEIKARVLEK